MSNQFIRKCSLIIYGASAIGAPPPSASTPVSGQTSATSAVTVPAPASAQPGIDLSQFRIRFNVRAMDVDMPPTADIYVYNLAQSTVQKIQNEFQNVVLQAGYQNGNFAVIFQGSIVRVRTGRLSNIDTFVHIMASNWDAYYNFGVVSATLKKGASPQQIAQAIVGGIANSPAAKVTPNALAGGAQLGYIPSSLGTGGTLPRGKVLFGLARERLSELAESQQCTWQIGPDGKINIIPLNGYLPGTAVVVTSQTGMIGVPEATQQGIEFKTLLNPLLVCGTQVKLDNASITTTANLSPSEGYPNLQSLAYFANTSADGTYRAIVVEHEGDTRSPADSGWLTKVTALALDQSSGQVQPYGWQGTQASQ